MDDPTQQPIVTVDSGRLMGRSSAGVASFLGVPYAAAPFGDKRFRPPQPLDPWTGTRPATEYGPTVPKGDYPPAFQPFFPEVVILGDECLNLNVWTPDPDATGLPVLVWIHGGSFTNGSGSLGEYDGSAFGRDGVVCVTINYRLGAEGFLFVEDGVANLGLLDQLAALRWVRTNIAAFGGDPARVTVAGQSAGAMSIMALLSSPGADGLFAQAIAQSGAPAHELTVTQGRAVSAYLAEALDTSPSSESFSQIPIELLTQAASQLVGEVQAGSNPERWGKLALSLLPFAPTVDGTVLPLAPSDAIAAGLGGNVPLLIGSNGEEARLFLVDSFDLIDDATLNAAAAGYGLEPNGLAVYRENHPEASPGDLLAAVITDWYFRIPAVRVAEVRDEVSAAATWMYRFDYPQSTVDQPLGACHGAEIPFVFNTATREELRPRIGDAPSQAVAETMHSAWIAFIETGSPGWSPYSRSDRTTALLSENIAEVVDPAGSERRVWDGIR